MDSYALHDAGTHLVIAAGNDTQNFAEIAKAHTREIRSMRRAFYVTNANANVPIAAFSVSGGRAREIDRQTIIEKMDPAELAEIIRDAREDWEN